MIEKEHIFVVFQSAKWIKDKEDRRYVARLDVHYVGTKVVR